VRGREGGVEFGVGAAEGPDRRPTAVAVMGSGAGAVRVQVREGSLAATPHPVVWRVSGGDDDGAAGEASAGASTPRRCTLENGGGQSWSRERMGGRTNERR
jgi:hypothetical protein